MVALLVSFALAAPEIPLDPAAEAALAAGDAAWGRTADGGSEHAWGARVIDAPLDRVWDRILDFEGYAELYPYVTRSTLDELRYEDGLPVYVSTMQLTAGGFTTRYRLESEPHLDQGWLGFEVAPVGRSPVRSAHGWWRVEPWRGEPDQTLVTYGLEVDAEWWVPGWFRNLAARRGIPAVLDALDERLTTPQVTAAN